MPETKKEQLSDSEIQYLNKIKVTTDHRGSNETILVGQSGYASDKNAFMLDSETMVIYGDEPHDGPNYLTKEQAMKMFNLVEA